MDITVIGNRERITLFKSRLQLEDDKYLHTRASIKFHTYKFRGLRFVRKKFIDYLILNDIDIFWYMKNYGTYRIYKKGHVIVTVHDLMSYFRPDLQGGKRSIWRTLRRFVNVHTLCSRPTL